jgi:hypothetical protein
VDSDAGFGKANKNGAFANLNYFHIQNKHPK